MSYSTFVLYVHVVTIKLITSLPGIDLKRHYKWTVSCQLHLD